MKGILIVTAVVLSLALVPGAGARGPHGGGGGGFQGHHGGPHGGFGPGFRHGFGHPRTRVFIGGSFFFDPFFYDPFYSYPYYVPYPYPAYVYPPPPEYGWSAPEPPGGEEEEQERAENPPPTAEDAARATYGLVQLRGVPNGASVDLDGRFWLTAQGLDQRWLAVPRGEHTIAVRVRDADVVERRIEVKEGKNHVVRFGPFRHATG